jgi:hypothetical protein
MATATIIENGTDVIVKSPYNASLVSDIKALPGRKWNPDEKAWSVSGKFSKEIRAIVAKYFEIEGGQSTIEYETVRVRVTAKSSSKRSYCGNVAIDGHDIVNSLYGNVRRNDDSFEIIEERGGFTYGDSRHAFGVEYELVLKVRKGAEFKNTGHADYWGTHSFMKEAAPVVEAPVKVRKPRVKKVSPFVAALQIPEGKKARLVKGQIVIK